MAPCHAIPGSSGLQMSCPRHCLDCLTPELALTSEDNLYQVAGSPRKDPARIVRLACGGPVLATVPVSAQGSSGICFFFRDYRQPVPGDCADRPPREVLGDKGAAPQFDSAGTRGAGTYQVDANAGTAGQRPHAAQSDRGKPLEAYLSDCHLAGTQGSGPAPAYRADGDSNRQANDAGRAHDAVDRMEPRRQEGKAPVCDNDGGVAWQRPSPGPSSGEKPIPA